MVMCQLNGDMVLTWHCHLDKKLKKKNNPMVPKLPDPLPLGTPPKPQFLFFSLSPKHNSMSDIEIQKSVRIVDLFWTLSKTLPFDTLFVVYHIKVWFFAQIGIWLIRSSSEMVKRMQRKRLRAVSPATSCDSWLIPNLLVSIYVAGGCVKNSRFGEPGLSDWRAW